MLLNSLKILTGRRESVVACHPVLQDGTKSCLVIRSTLTATRRKTAPDLQLAVRGHIYLDAACVNTKSVSEGSLGLLRHLLNQSWIVNHHLVLVRLDELLKRASVTLLELSEQRRHPLVVAEHLLQFFGRLWNSSYRRHASAPSRPDRRISDTVDQSVSSSAPDRKPSGSTGPLFFLFPIGSNLERSPKNSSSSCPCGDFAEFCGTGSVLSPSSSTLSARPASTASWS